MQKIKLTKGYFALIDDEDHDLVSQFEWFVYGKERLRYAGSREYIEHAGIKKPEEFQPDLIFRRGRQFGAKRCSEWIPRLSRQCRRYPLKGTDLCNVHFYGQYSTKLVIVPMHRLKMNALNGIEVDHLNGNGLDNQRANLRLCNHQQNSANRRMNINSKSGYKGVNRLSQIKPEGRNPWRATIRVSGLKIHIGCFATRDEAARAYDEAALEHYGEFALTNKSMGLLS